jgi:hypothetical protein
VPDGFLFQYQCAKKTQTKKGSPGAVYQYPVDKDITIKALIPKLNQKQNCNVVDESVLFSLNLPAIEASSAYTPPVKANYRNAHVVPRGFSFKYKCQ